MHSLDAEKHVKYLWPLGLERSSNQALQHPEQTLVCTLRNVKYIAKHCKYICQRIFAHSAETHSTFFLHHHLGAACICTFIYFGVVAKARQGHHFVHTLVGRYNR